MSDTSIETPDLTYGRSVADQRLDYRIGELDVGDLAGDPFTQFDQWFAEAVSQTAAQQQLDEPSAMTLATASINAIPSARTVLLKGFDKRGFTWFTNYESRKGCELTENPFASLCFRWSTGERQVVICGPVTQIDAVESDEYFFSRPPGSRVGAVVSAQSTVIADRSGIEGEAARLLVSPDDVLRPAHWGGFRLSPITVEFWQGRSSRLHDRLQFVRQSSDSTDTAWKVQRLSP